MVLEKQPSRVPRTRKHDLLTKYAEKFVCEITVCFRRANSQANRTRTNKIRLQIGRNGTRKNTSGRGGLEGKRFFFPGSSGLGNKTIGLGWLVLLTKFKPNSIVHGEKR